MFLRFTKKFSRPVYGFIIALLMLFAPALIVTTVESAPQKNKAKPTPTPKKKAAPDKKTQAKTKPTPTPAKSKTKSKNEAQTASKNKTSSRKNEKNTSAKTNQKTSDRNKNSKTTDKKNSKQTLAANNKIPSKNAKNERNAKNDRNAKTSDKNKNSSTKNAKLTADKNRSKQTVSKTTKPTIAKTSVKKTPKSKTVETKSKTADLTKTADKTPEKTPEKTIETPTTELPQVIVTTFSVPVRSQAKADAQALSSVKLGTVLKVTEKNPAWYKVQYPEGGKTSVGWVSANAVNDLNASTKTEIYRQIVERNYKPQMDFESASEFYEFTSKVESDLDASDKSADIELKRLLALRSALKTIPADRRETAPYKDFLKAQEKEIVYNEPAGVWLVVSNEFWNLHNKYRKSSISDTIAWEAANNPLPGECEGYVNCYLFDMRMRFGEYLNLHPNGSHAGEALKGVTDYLSPIVADSQAKKVYNGPTDVTDRAEFNNLIAELRTIIARLPFVEKEKTLQQLRTIAEAYR